MGTDVADERVFRDIIPENDGMLHLDFASQSGPSELNAIEIMPGLPHDQRTIRIVARPTPCTDHTGHSLLPPPSPKNLDHASSTGFPFAKPNSALWFCGNHAGVPPWRTVRILPSKTTVTEITSCPTLPG